MLKLVILEVPVIHFEQHFYVSLINRETAFSKDENKR